MTSVEEIQKKITELQNDQEALDRLLDSGGVMEKIAIMMCVYDVMTLVQHFDSTPSRDEFIERIVDLLENMTRLEQK